MPGSVGSVIDAVPSRRTVTKGLAWTVPAVAVTAPARAHAVSGACSFIANFSVDDSAPVLLATSPDTARQIRIDLSTLAGPCTTLTAQNLGRGGSGTQQNWNDPCATQDFSGFGPAGAVVLNQVSTKDGCDRSTACGPEVHDAQDVTFTFSDVATGAPVAGIGDVRLEVFDITSVAEFQGSSDWSSPTAPYWAGRYYDAVGFDVTPTSIIPSAYDPGAGTGSLSDPFHRTGSKMPSESGRIWQDSFLWSALPGSSLVLRYTNLFYGYHFVSVSGLSFTAPC